VPPQLPHAQFSLTPTFLWSVMRLKRSLQDDRGFMNLGSAIIGVILIIIIILAFGGVTAEVLQTSTIASQNASRASTARSKIELLYRTSAPLPTSAGSSVLIDSTIGNGWTWTSTTTDGAPVLKVAIPKFGHAVSECQDIALTGSLPGRCVIAQKIIRTDLAGMKITPVSGWTTNTANTVITVPVPAGWPTLRYFMPVSYGSANMTVQIASSLSKSGSTAPLAQPASGKITALGEIDILGVAQTITFTIVGGTVDTSTAIFYRGAFG
jgi:type II secretory pathway pseudopilin PulG